MTDQLIRALDIARSRAAWRAVARYHTRRLRQEALLAARASLPGVRGAHLELRHAHEDLALIASLASSSERPQSPRTPDIEPIAAALQRSIPLPTDR